MNKDKFITDKLTEFDEEFGGSDGQDFFDAERISRVKSFLQKSLHQQKEMCLEKIEGLEKGLLDVDEKAIITINGMRTIHNECLSQVKAIIQEP